jgi:hypothetical protein
MGKHHKHTVPFSRTGHCQNPTPLGLATLCAWPYNVERLIASGGNVLKLENSIPDAEACPIEIAAIKTEVAIQGERWSEGGTPPLGEILEIGGNDRRLATRQCEGVLDAPRRVNPSITKLL